MPAAQGEHAEERAAATFPLAQSVQSVAALVTPVERPAPQAAHTVEPEFSA